MSVVNTGTCPAYEDIKDVKDNLSDFLDISGVGPKKAKELVDKGFTSIETLRKSPNLSELLNDKQLIGLKYYEDILERIPREEIDEHNSYMKGVLQRIDPSAEMTIAGSYRRRQADSGDIDVLLKSENPKVFDELITRLTKLGYLVGHLAHGKKKYNGVCQLGKKGIFRRIDIMYTKPEEYPFAIFYFTGSDEFNKKVRKQILDQGMTINEYSLKDNETKEKVDYEFNVEKDIFDYLEMDYVEPQDRL